MALNIVINLIAISYIEQNIFFNFNHRTIQCMVVLPCITQWLFGNVFATYLQQADFATKAFYMYYNILVIIFIWKGVQICHQRLYKCFESDLAKTAIQRLNHIHSNAQRNQHYWTILVTLLSRQQFHLTRSKSLNIMVIICASCWYLTV